MIHLLMEGLAGGYGSTDGQTGQDSIEQTREEQGYGSGSGVGG